MKEEKRNPAHPAARSRKTPQDHRSSPPLRLDHAPGIQPLADERLLDIIEFLPDATFVIDVEGRVVAWNRAIEEMTGVAKSDILGKGDYLYAVPFYGKPRPIIIDFARGTTEDIVSLYEYVEKEGDTCFAETFSPLLYEGKGAFLWGKATPLLDCQGNIIGAVESIRDVTLRKQAEIKLKESEEKYRLIFQNTPLGIFHFDNSGIVTDCNDKIIAIWGSSKEKFIGFNLLASMKNKKMKAAVMSCLAGQYAFYEGSYLSVTGGKITDLKAHYGPILSADDGVAGGIAIVEDISERKRAEEALQESERQLRQLSAQLIATQENERKRIARELHDTIGSSLSGIKFSMENALELARKSKLDPESLKSIIVMVQHAIEESRRLTADLRPSVLDDLGIITTIHWFTRQFQAVYGEIAVRTQIAVEEEDIPEYLKIVIFRLIQEAFHNIAKHSKASTVGITLGKTRETLYLEIQDNGLGFDPANLAARGNRNGMGLLSMRERTELVGGRLAIESREGCGTLLRACWPSGG